MTAKKKPPAERAAASFKAYFVSVPDLYRISVAMSR